MALLFNLFYFIMYFYSLINIINLNTNLFNLNNGNAIQNKLNNKIIDLYLFNVNTKTILIIVSILIFILS
jgi:hypothetical protein